MLILLSIFTISYAQIQYAGAAYSELITMDPCQTQHNLYKVQNTFFAVCDLTIKKFTPEWEVHWEADLTTPGYQMNIVDIKITNNGDVRVAMNAKPARDDLATLAAAGHPLAGQWRGYTLDLNEDSGSHIAGTWVLKCGSSGDSYIVSLVDFDQPLVDCDLTVSVTDSVFIARGAKNKVIALDSANYVVSVSYWLSKLTANGDTVWSLAASRVADDLILDFSIVAETILVTTKKYVKAYSLDSGDELWEVMIPGTILASHATSYGVVLSTHIDYDFPKFEYTYVDSTSCSIVWIDYNGNIKTFRNFPTTLVTSLSSTDVLILGTSENTIMITKNHIFERRFCHENCKTCFGETQTECYTCNTYEYGEYGCGACAENCAVCSGRYEHECTRCESGYIMSDDGQCDEDLNCPIGQYQSNQLKMCKHCSVRCTSCTEHACLTCLENHSLIDGDCVQTCPDGTYSSDGECKDCDITCAKCSGPGPKDCMACEGLYLHEGLCIEECPYSWYVEDGVCRTCGDHCVDCRDGKCYACSAETVLYESMCLDVPLPGNYFHNKVMLPCSDHCEVCQSEIMCSVCDQGYYLTHELTCMLKPICEENEYFVDGRCLPCHSNCEHCYGPTPNECLRCVDAYLLQDESCTTVKNFCPNGQYANYENKCAPCNSSCLTCDTDSSCTTCISGYVHENTCVEVCPTGTFVIDDTRCESCPDTCIACDSQGRCQDCIDRYVLSDGECVTKCPGGEYSLNGICTPCADNCQLCQSATCTTCAAGFYNEGAGCAPCSDGCEACRGPNTCDRCVSGLNLAIFSPEKSGCYDICPARTFHSGVVCQPCSDPLCLNCPGDICEKCKLEVQGKGRHRLDDGVCIEGKYDCMDYQEGENCERTENQWRKLVYGIIKAFL